MERVLLQPANSLLQPAKKVRIQTKFLSFYKTLGRGHLPRLIIDEAEIVKVERKGDLKLSFQKDVALNVMKKKEMNDMPENAVCSKDDPCIENISNFNFLDLLTNDFDTPPTSAKPNQRMAVG